MKTTPILDRMLAELPDFRGLLSLIPDAVRAGAELVPTPSGFDILLDESRTLHVSVATMAVIVNDTADTTPVIYTPAEEQFMAYIRELSQVGMQTSTWLHDYRPDDQETHDNYAAWCGSIVRGQGHNPLFRIVVTSIDFEVAARLQPEVAA